MRWIRLLHVQNTDLLSSTNDLPGHFARSADVRGSLPPLPGFWCRTRHAACEPPGRRDSATDTIPFHRKRLLPNVNSTNFLNTIPQANQPASGCAIPLPRKLLPHVWRGFICSLAIAAPGVCRLPPYGLFSSKGHLHCLWNSHLPTNLFTFPCSWVSLARWTVHHRACSLRYCLFCLPIHV